MHGDDHAAWERLSQNNKRNMQDLGLEPRSLMLPMRIPATEPCAYHLTCNNKQIRKSKTR